MSNTTPIESIFGFQRTAVEQSHKATLEAFEAQTTAMEQFSGSLGTIEDLQAQGVSGTRDAMHAYLDSVEELNPEAELDEVRELVDEGFDTTVESHEQTWDAVAEAVDEAVDATESATETYTELVDDSFDSFLAAHEEIEATTTEMAEQVDDATPEPDELAN